MLQSAYMANFET